MLLESYLNIKYIFMSNILHTFGVLGIAPVVRSGLLLRS
jgi:hypothetical protein